MTIEALTWLGILACVSQSAMFSGLNLAFFSLSRMRLEIEVSTGNEDARKVLERRNDPNRLLATILFGNVAINVLLTLLSESMLAGMTAFFFSTVVITAFGEILPQAYFSRNALRVASVLGPLFDVYRWLLYPVAKPVGMLLDSWLGPEGLMYYREREFRRLIRKHIEASEADIDRIEGLGALNFLSIDDLPIADEGQALHPASIVKIPFDGEQPVFPDYAPERRDAFLQALNASGEKWVVLTDDRDRPRLVIDADGFLRDALFSAKAVDPGAYCHRPIIVTDGHEKLGNVLPRWTVEPAHARDNVVDRDLILVWNDVRMVVTGADVLGLLLVGIAEKRPGGQRVLQPQAT